MLYVCVLCASCGSYQCRPLHDLQFFNAGLGCKGQHYGRGIFQSGSRNCLVGSHECLLFTPSCCSECFHDLWMCVRNVSIGRLDMGNALLCIFKSRLIVYSAGSGVNRVQVVLPGFSKRLLLDVGMVECISFAAVAIILRIFWGGNTCASIFSAFQLNIYPSLGGGGVKNKENYVFTIIV